MLLWTIVKVALKSLFANKLRSFLAMLGIIIGVGAVIAMLAMGAGAKKAVMDRIYAMGTDLLVVRPGQHGMHGVMSGTQQNLTLEDAQAVLEKVPGVLQVAPVVGGNAQLKYFNKNARGNVIGTGITYFPTRNFEIEKGRTFTEGEVDRMARVAVLGPVTVQNLFETEDPVNATIKLNGINFQVVGVLKSKGDQGWFNPDDQVLVPYTTAMKQLFGLEYLREIDVQGVKGSDLSKIEEATSAVLRTRHRLQGGAPDDFSIRNQAEMVQMVTSVNRTFTILLGGIASISLLVGGIGIMNIMLVTVTERTREIGVRKAIGAKDRDILRQFLIEALLMSGLGGLIGVAIGVGAARLISGMTDFATAVELQSVLMALSFAGAVGVFFGYYPARRAAKLDPIEALRYE
jgi:putative ABC transport system permease protein